jgi:hypothetical protein
MMEGYFWIPRLMLFKVRGCLPRAFEYCTCTWFFLFCSYTYSQIPIASKPTWTKNHGEIDKKTLWG